MSDLVDGAQVPWYIVSGRQDPEKPARRSDLPDPVVREPARELSAQVAANTMADAIRACDAELAEVRMKVGTAAVHAFNRAIEQLESRRRWFQSITDSLKEHQ